MSHPPQNKGSEAWPVRFSATFPSGNYWLCVNRTNVIDLAKSWRLSETNGIGLVRNSIYPRAGNYGDTILISAASFLELFVPLFRDRTDMPRVRAIF